MKSIDVVISPPCKSLVEVFSFVPSWQHKTTTTPRRSWSLFMSTHFVSYVTVGRQSDSTSRDFTQQLLLGNKILMSWFQRSTEYQSSGLREEDSKDFPSPGRVGPIGLPTIPLAWTSCPLQPVQ